MSFELETTNRDVSVSMSELDKAISGVITPDEFVPKLENIYKICSEYLIGFKNMRNFVMEDHNNLTDDLWDSSFKSAHMMTIETEQHIDDLSMFLLVKMTNEENIADLEKYERIFETIKNILMVQSKYSEDITEFSEKRTLMMNRANNEMDYALKFIKHKTMMCDTEFDEEKYMSFMSNHSIWNETSFRISGTYDVSHFLSFTNDSIVGLNAILELCVKIRIYWKKLTQKHTHSSSSNFY